MLFRSVTLTEPSVAGVDLAAVCSVTNRGGEDPKFWAKSKNNPANRKLLNETLHLDLQNHDQFKRFFATAGLVPQVAAATLNIAAGTQDGNATVHDPVENEWTPVKTLLARAAAPNSPAAYLDVVQKLNTNKLMVTPSNPSACGSF